MTAFAHHLTTDLRSSLRNRQLIFLNYAFPLAFYALMGLIMTGINPTFTETMVPAMAIFAVMMATLMGIPDALIVAKEAGILRSYRIYGVPAFNILVMPALTTTLHMAVVVLVVAVTANPFFGAPLPTNWAWFLVITAATAFAHAGLAVLIGVVASGSRVTLLWSQLVFLPSMLLAGLMIPFSMLPASAQSLGMLLPATYAMNAFRGLAYGLPVDFEPLVSVAVLALGGLAAFGLASLLFTWDRNNETRRLPLALALLAMLPYAAMALAV